MLRGKMEYDFLRIDCIKNIKKKTKFKTTENTLAGFLRWWNRIDNQSYSF